MMYFSRQFDFLFNEGLIEKLSIESVFVTDDTKSTIPMNEIAWELKY